MSGNPGYYGQTLFLMCHLYCPCADFIPCEHPVHFLHQLVRYRLHYDAPLLILSAQPEPYLFICNHFEVPFLSEPYNSDNLINVLQTLLASPHDFQEMD